MKSQISNLKFQASRHRLAVTLLLVIFGVVARGHAQVARQTLATFARTHGFPTCKVSGKTITVACRFHAFAFEGNSRRVSYNGTDIWLSYPVTEERGSWTIARVDAEKILLPLVFPHRGLMAAGPGGLVVLDAGHGGKDQGAAAPRLVEKDLTLKLAALVRDRLAAKGVHVRLARSRDTALELAERCELAERWGADLFVSLHANAAADRTARGIETHVLPPAGCPITASADLTGRDYAAYSGNRFDMANTYLGYLLQKRLLAAAGAPDRGLRRSRFFVLRNAPCPAALVEVGFLSNSGDADQLRRRAYLDKLAQGIADGICEYLEALQRAHRLMR